MTLTQILSPEIKKAIQELFGVAVEKIEFQATRKEFEGDITMVIFPLLKQIKSNPVELGNKIGQYLVDNVQVVSKFNVVSGFLNIVIADEFYVNYFNEIKDDAKFGFVTPSAEDKAVLVEYSSPNTNKPLHLGHVRNNLLGFSVAQILKANGYNVTMCNLVNDRGIHICKSMFAWMQYGNGETPQSAGIKGDHLVGKYYVEFDKAYKAEVKELIEKGVAEKDAEKQSPIMQQAVEMLLKWEAKDPETIQLWKTMNGWVYDGFTSTYKTMGVNFEKLYYESETYLLGKDEVLRGVEQRVFFKKEDGSVWVDLTADGLDQKVLLRADGTSVYMTQDIGTAILRFQDFPKISRQVYTVGNEQEYHFKVLFLILKKLGYQWAEKCYHLSYGMVDLPSGKMKSREGTVVDADDLMQEMEDEADKQTHEYGKLEGINAGDANALFEMIGLGAL